MSRKKQFNGKQFKGRVVNDIKTYIDEESQRLTVQIDFEDETCVSISAFSQPHVEVQEFIGTSLDIGVEKKLTTSGAGEFNG